MHSPYLQPDALAWVRASVADLRAHPAHAAEQTTQALQGEACEPLRVEDGWLEVRLPDGYVGWMRDWHVVAATVQEVARFGSRCTSRLNIAWTPVFSSPGSQAPPVAETILGTRVVAGPAVSGWAPVELPTGIEGWVPASHLVHSIADWEPLATSVCNMLQSFLGVPYVWGGRSPKGFDCSGLVQFVYGLHGIALPRDSPQQFDSGTPVSGEPLPGDLLFFADPVAHVAVQFDAQRYIHTRGCVRFNSLDPAHPLYDASLAQQFRGSKRVLPQNAAGGSAT
jgi:cell wall-associated NlpC family hydrolase